MRTIDSGARCCPKCKGTAFDKHDRDEDKTELGGFNIRCRNTACGWKGFLLQLVAKVADVQG